MERIERRRNKYTEEQKKAPSYQIGEKVLVRNRELPSTPDGITKKLLLLYTEAHLVSKNNGNNTYEITDIRTRKVKGNYNQASLKRYYEGEQQI